MLQKIRDKTQNWISILIIGFLILMFGMWGISYYLSGSSVNQQSVVQVNGQSIPLRQYQTVYNYERQAASQEITNGSLTVNTLKKAVLSSLIQDQLLYQGAMDAGLGMSAQALDSYIASMPIFQAKGQFSQALYQSYLQNQGIDTQGLRDRLKQSLLINQWRLGFSESNFILPHELGNYNNLLNQTRSVQILLLPFSNSNSLSTNQNKIPSPTAQELQAYYQTHQEDFRLPEKFKLNYLILSVKDLEKNLKLSDQAAQEKYADLGNQLANLTFENPQSLDPAASQLGLVIQHTDWISGDWARQHNLKNLPSILNNPAVLQAALSNDVLHNGQNSDPINLSPDTVMVLRIGAYEPSAVQPFAQVKNLCIDGVMQEKKIRNIQNLADQIKQSGNLEKYNQTHPQSQFFKSLTAARSGFDKNNLNKINLTNLNNPILLNSIFNMRVSNSLTNSNSSNNSNIQEILIPNLGYALVQLIKINPAPDLNLKTAVPMAQDLRSNLASLDYLEYLQGLEASAKIITNPNAANLL